ncbi:DHH family phosphoesterase [Natrialbaceae archaeon AArc-T1-2]|uniref:DHH family phosphoesterase n=1 Tax=Natrialbaceae archaeon AArc-T1-2 TaxID=3053904 RepID=UPI00255B2AAA|nr:OB-fold nucleic acid binding domain-containing protein [Natrialbaceae archaeon AArc-T1-2]WIV67851.1 OB-fold nucleic acid binding domain-containing protein [Natrialbaceae archaeon AArc-T1-2]
MGNCIICGKPVDGLVCATHEEDVVFEFDGDDPSQLTPDRYYRGVVDGYADFGVFVDLGDHVTGLLHRSELDRRLESLDWEPGDTVYVQVLDVRDNGNVDLGWSIRQDDREFRGTLIDAPDGEYRLDDVEGEEDEYETDESTPAESPADEPAPDESATTTNGGDTTPAEEGESEPATPTMEIEEPEPPLKRTTIDALAEQVGSVVRLEGEITGARQTSGPTVFELSDETATVECAAFEEAGVRAYPAVEVGDVVRLEGEVERHQGDLQVETETLEILEDEDREDVRARLEDAIEQQARPERVEPLAGHDAIVAIEDELVEAATAIRRAVTEARPIVVRHTATADGYVAGAALERAVLPLIREKHTRDDAEYHYFERRPLDGQVYDMDAATDDVTSMLEARDRHGEQLPLVVLVDAGSTVESADGYDLLEVYGADRLVIDDSHADEAILEDVSLAVNPTLADAGDVTTTAVAVNVAVHVNDEVYEDLGHLPAVSYWEDTPEVYAELAAEAGYDETDISERREAVALEAYYQSYKDKRELIADLLFDDAGDLASHVSGQFRDKLETELETARENLETESVGDVTVAVLDTEAFTHRFDFPPTDLLLDELHRRDREGDRFVTLGLDEDELHVRSTTSVDVRELGETIAETTPDAGVRVVGGHDGYIEFLAGERDAVREAALEALGETLA